MLENQGSILVIDDHPDNLRTLSTFLQEEGYKVRKASSGAMALVTIHSQPPDLILLDIRMPQMDGFEVCSFIKQSPQTQDLPIIFISASDDIEDKVKAFNLGGADYITKPFRREEVLARIKHQLTIRQQQQKLSNLYQQVQDLNTNLEQQVQERTKELQQALTELERLNKLKDDFLSTISHELRTPLANMWLVLQLLMAATDQGNDFFKKLYPSAISGAANDKIVQYLRILQDECDRELHLVQDLLDLQQLTADTCPLELATINLYDWLPHILDSFEIQLQNKQQTLEVQLASNLPLLETDLTYLNRILTELINNGCKYSPPGETITVTVSIVSQKKEGEQVFESLSPSLAISVDNSGVEIPPEERSRIFDKFYRIPSGNPWQHGGTGLGLALVKKLAEHLGGSIVVTTANNHTCFTLKLPVEYRESDNKINAIASRANS